MQYFIKKKNLNYYVKEMAASYSYFLTQSTGLNVKEHFEFSWH